MLNKTLSGRSYQASIPAPPISVSHFHLSLLSTHSLLQRGLRGPVTCAVVGAPYFSPCVWLNALLLLRSLMISEQGALQIPQRVLFAFCGAPSPFSRHALRPHGPSTPRASRIGWEGRSQCRRQKAQGRAEGPTLGSLGACPPRAAGASVGEGVTTDGHTARGELVMEGIKG